jgi:hypothetical protein
MANNPYLMVRSRSEYYAFSSVLKTKFDRLYTILQKNGGTDTKAMGQTEPHFLPDPTSDRKKKFSPNQSYSA